MRDAQPFSIRRRVESFGHALRGIRRLVADEHNARIHAVATICTAVSGAFLGLDRLEWCLLLVAMGLVWCAEAMNAAVERTCEAITQEQNSLIGQAKDLAAGGVLCAALGAAMLGALVFGPHLWALAP